MNKIILRFCIVKNREVFEAILDSRLSFSDNFNLLGDICDIDKNAYIFDQTKRVFLDRNVPISVYNFNNFVTLFLY